MNEVFANEKTLVVTPLNFNKFILRAIHKFLYHYISFSLIPLNISFTMGRVVALLYRCHGESSNFYSACVNVVLQSIIISSIINAVNGEDDST